VEERLASHGLKLEELKDLVSGVSDKVDASTLQEQIAVMEQVKTELEREVIGESKGFSLFGWLNKMLSKK